VLVLAASGDKTHRGASIAAPSMAWIRGTLTLEQLDQPPAGAVPGTQTRSSAPPGRPIARPAIVACRYQRELCP